MSKSCSTTIGVIIFAIIGITLFLIFYSLYLQIEADISVKEEARIASQEAEKAELISRLKSITIESPPLGREWFYDKTIDTIIYSKEIVSANSSKDESWEVSASGRGNLIHQYIGMYGESYTTLKYWMYVKNPDGSIEPLTLNADDDSTKGEKIVRLVIGDYEPTILKVQNFQIQTGSYGSDRETIGDYISGDIYLDFE